MSPPQRLELDIREDGSILPANLRPPWSEAFFMRLSVDRFINVYHPTEVAQAFEGVTKNLCHCYDPVEVGTVEDHLYLPLRGLISYDTAKQFFRDILDAFEVPVDQETLQFADKFSTKMCSMAANALVCNRKIVPVILEMKIGILREYHPGIFERSIPEYVNKIMGSGSTVPFSSIQAMKRIKVDSSSMEQYCSICHESFKGEQETVQLPCSHIYHPDCICKWFISNPSCPLCRSHIE